MANRSEWGGCLGWLAVGSVFLWFATSPDDDQVCRTRKTWVFDALHGVDGQPTCQQLIDQLDAQAVEARRRASALEDRLSEVESRLNM